MTKSSVSSSFFLLPFYMLSLLGCVGMSFKVVCSWFAGSGPLTVLSQGIVSVSCFLVDEIMVTCLMLVTSAEG